MRMRFAFIGFCLIAILGVVLVQAQRGGAPAQSGGDSAPVGRGVYQPILWLPDEAFPRWTYPAEDSAYNKMDGFNIKSYINDITAISRKSRDDGNQYWGRITGTPYDKMTTDWVEAQFRRIGLE